MSQRAAVTFQPCPHGEASPSEMPDEHRESCVLWHTSDGRRWFQITGSQRVEEPYRLTVRSTAEAQDERASASEIRTRPLLDRLPAHPDDLLTDQDKADIRDRLAALAHLRRQVEHNARSIPLASTAARRSAAPDG